MTSAHGPKMPVPDHKTVAIHTLRQRLSDGVTTWRQHFSRAPGRGRLAGLYRRLSDTICRRCVGISWHSGMKTMAALRNFNLGILYLPRNYVCAGSFSDLQWLRTEQNGFKDFERLLLLNKVKLIYFKQCNFNPLYCISHYDLYCIIIIDLNKGMSPHKTDANIEN